jgi:hypothetical protein
LSSTRLFRWHEIVWSAVHPVRFRLVSWFESHETSSRDEQPSIEIAKTFFDEQENPVREPDCVAFVAETHDQTKTCLIEDWARTAFEAAMYCPVEPTP